MRLKIAGLIGLVFAFGCFVVQAQSTRPEYEYSKKIDAAKKITQLTSTSFGNVTSESTGQTVFSAVDVDIPGSSKLPVRFGRRLPISLRYFDQELTGIGNWDVEVPYIEGTFSKLYGWSVGNASVSYRYNRCSHPDAPAVEGGTFTSAEVFHGYNIHVPGEVDDSLLIDTTAYADPDDGKVYPWILKSFDRLGCLPSLKNDYPGEGFVLLTKDGMKYYFDYMVERKASTLRKGPKGCDENSTTPTSTCASLSIRRTRFFLLATRIEDRFGNYVNYQYDSAGRPLSITANDGRAISAQYSANSVSVTAGGRTWLYTIQDGNLVSVTNPDGSLWRYTPFGMPTQVPGWEPGPDTLPSETFNPDDDCLYTYGTGPYWGKALFEVTHPSGAKANFELSGQSIYRSGVPYICDIIYTSPDGTAGAAHVAISNYFDVFSLTKISISGPGLSPEVTTYDYGLEFYPYCDAILSVTGDPVGPRCTEDACSSIDYPCSDSVGRWVVTTLPDGGKLRKRFGVIYGINEGRLLAEEVLNQQGAVVRRVDYQYLPDALAGNQAFGGYVGIPLTTDPMNPKIRPLISTQITQEGVTYKSEVQLCNGMAYCFTDFAQPTRVKRSNTAGPAATDVTEYENNLGLWVLDQPKRGINLETGIVEYENSYNAQALLQWSKKFGKLQQTLTYNTDGTVATVADGRGNVTTLTNWKRGIPQNIQYPATPEAPVGASESAVVNDNGWVTSVTDEIGSKTCYGYDAMGRVNSVLYPSETQSGVCDTSRWSARGFEFRPLVSGDWLPSGITNGQWRSYEGVGSYAKFTYFDAMWRPVLVQEYDTSNAAGTIRYTRTAYDSNGRVSFQSYPVSDPATATTGTRTSYDALDRVTRVEQDSELGVLVTTTQYLTGLKTLVTNPRGLQTTTSYMAWDQPGYDLPIRSDQPENKVIEIARHPQFGWPLQLKQRSADNSLQMSRQYVYDGNAQLCKTIEPETGVSVMGYDEAGNLTWQASGLQTASFGSTTDCQHGPAYATGLAVTREYDSHNRLTRLNFPNGGRGNQIWTYEKDNLPASVTAYNDVNNTTPVVTAYTYNKRRLPIGESLSQPSWYTWGVGYEYDSLGNLRWQSYPTGLTLDFAPNALGQATQARNASAPNNAFASGAQYYPNGALKQFTYGNGIVHTMTQNARQLPARVISSGNVADFDYSYDANGNPTAILDNVTGTPTARHRWMSYDGLDRLTTAASAVFGGSDHTHRFTYDALDNIRSWKHAGVKDYADYVYDPQNRLTSIRNTAGATVVGIGYDAQGNLQNKNGQTYDFDYGNRLRAVNGKEYYRYDGLGRRVSALEPTSNTILSQYTQSGQVVYQEDHRTQVASEHVYLAGSLIATRERNWTTSIYQTKYQHTDALGSPVAVTNDAGQVIERNDYEPYGAIIGKPARNGIGYTGHVMDGATGLTYMQQRYYDQSLGRFLSVDPVTANGSTGANFNRYWYANGNPYRFTDPDGRESVGEMIDMYAVGCGKYSCAGYAAANALWSVFGAEGVSQVADKGGAASTGDKVSAVLEVATAGKGKWIAKVGGRAGEMLKGLVRAGCSFDDETLVQTDRGLIPIAEIKVGDKVLSRNEETGIESYQKVEATFNDWHASTLTVRFEKSGVVEAIITTDDHPFFVVGVGFVQASSLKYGDVVQLAGGAKSVVVGAQRNTLGQLAYNLTVAKDHTYFVGRNKLWVHNQCATSLIRLFSLIKADPLLVREAQAAGKSVQKSLDDLTAKLAQGNMNPGIGTRNVFGNIFEARAADGARVYFRNVESGIEILAKSNKANQERVINRLRKLYE